MLFKYLRYKLWFVFELPQFIYDRKFKRGVELGAKGGRSLKRVLAKNTNLEMIGLDFWEITPGKAYKDNNLNEERCKKAVAKFGNRVKLYKGDALNIAEKIEDQSMDFVFYDLYNFRVSNKTLHQTIIKKWTPKIRKGGVMIGRDFHNADISEAITELGFIIEPCIIKGKPSERLKYFSV